MGPHDWLVQFGHFKTGWERAFEMRMWTAVEAAQEFVQERHIGIGSPETARVSVRHRDGGEVMFFTVTAVPTGYAFSTHANIS